MKLNIKPISQRDPAHGKLKMPGGGEVEDFGCLTVCLAMQFGLSVADVVEKDIYSGNYILWSKVVKAFPYEFEWVKNKTQQTYKDIIKQRIDRGLPAIFEVDFDNGVEGVQQHFCLAIGYDNNEILLNDPWTGETYFLSAIYFHIISMRLLTPLNYQPPKPPEEDEALNKCLAQLEAKEEKTEELSKKLDSLKTSYENLDKKRTKLSTKLGKYEELILSWQKLVGIDSDKIEEIDKIEEKIKELKWYKGKYEKNLPYDARKYTKWELLGATILKFLRQDIPPRENGS